jgi:hypothetical protein
MDFTRSIFTGSVFNNPVPVDAKCIIAADFFITDLVSYFGSRKLTTNVLWLHAGWAW